MKLSFFLPTASDHGDPRFTSASGIAQIATLAETLGFDGLAVSEHPIPGLDTFEYGGHHQVDPLIALTIAATVTTRLRLQTHLLVLPYRNPFLTAKSVATLDAMSGGRINLGVGAGYGEAEFAALGVDFSERNELTDEAIEVMKLVWRGDPLQYQGRHFDARGNAALPRPAQQPHPPIWIGGNSRRAIRRAVALGEGWIPFPNPPQIAAKTRSTPFFSMHDVRRGIALLRDEMILQKRTRPLDIVFMPLQLAPHSPCPVPSEVIASAEALAAAGITYFTCDVPGPFDAATLDGFLDNMRWFADNILSRIVPL